MTAATVGDKTPSAGSSLLDRGRTDLVIVAYAGRRPSSERGDRLRATSIAARVGRLLDALEPAAVVGAAAAGADLVVLEAAVARGIPAYVVLPDTTAVFRRSSVADVGGPWAALYDRLLASPQVHTEEATVTGAAGVERYLAGNRLILDRAQVLAAADQVVAVGVLGQERATADVTAAFLREAAGRGLITVRLDPRSGAISVRGGLPDVDGYLGAGPATDRPPELVASIRDAIDRRNGPG